METRVAGVPIEDKWPGPDAAVENEEDIRDTVEQSDAADDNVEPSFFEEEEECRQILRDIKARLPLTNEGLLPSVGQDPEGVAALMELRFARIVNRYQDSPHLLHPHLEELMEPLTDLLLRYLPNAAELWTRSASSGSKGTHITAPSPPSQGLVLSSTLGQDLSMFDADAPKSPLHLVCRCLYCIIKTAGEKCCTSHFSNEVKYFEDVFYTVQLWVQDETRHREWEVRYCLLLWLSNLILVPFSLTIIDTNEDQGPPSPVQKAGERAPLTGAAAALGLATDVSLSDATLILACRFLADNSKCREAAALLVARLLTRPDSARHREIFFQLVLRQLLSRVTSAPISMPPDGPEKIFYDGTCVAFSAALAQPFLLPGLLLAIAKTMKLGKREELAQFAAPLLPHIATLVDHHPNDSLLCKTAVKVGQRLVLAMLKRRTAGWRYQRHVASLAENLSKSTGFTAADVPSPPAASSVHPPPLASNLDGNHNDEDDDDAIDGDEESLETGIGLLLQAIGHKDTVVRWSAAKGVGRVCERLPASLSEEVVSAVLLVFENEYSDAEWHGGLLTMAELCRRSLISTGTLAALVPVVEKGLKFELSKGTYSVGANVRDAACYTCWSVARAYDADDLTPHVDRLSVSLIVAALLDREINVRRAASAAFQECVGRLGNFEHGIDLVTTVDFFALASLQNTYTIVAPKVAQYATYRAGILQELVSTKLVHWDRTLRQAAATSLGLVTLHEPADTIVRDVVPELLRRVEDPAVATRHGAILALAALIDCLPSSTWDSNTTKQFLEVLTRLDSARLFRSRGGEFVRHACCAMLRAMARRRLELPEFVSFTKVTGESAKARTLARVQTFLDETSSNILDWVQAAAAETFNEFAAVYYTKYDPNFHGKVMRKMMEGCGPEKPIMERRGVLAVIGGLPAPLLCASWSATVSTPTVSSEGCATEDAAPAFELIIPMLQDAAVLSTADVESRSNAVRSLSAILVKIPLEVSAGPTITPALYAAVLGTLLTASRDYATDKRGDVGSFVRLAVLQQLPSVLRYGMQSAMPLCTSAMWLLTLQCTVRCLLEKLDKVRAVAGAVLVSLLIEDVSWRSRWPVSVVPLEIELLAGHVRRLTEEMVNSGLSTWSSPRFVMEELGSYLLCRCSTTVASAAMEGLLVSAGDLTEHVRRFAMSAILSAFRSPAQGVEEGSSMAGPLSSLLLAVLHDHKNEERLLKPSSIVLDTLLTEEVLVVPLHQELMVLLRREMKHFAKNIVVLLPMVTLLANLCHSPDPVARKAAWGLALTIIASRYPKVRAKMAADLYTALLMLTSGAASHSVEQDFPMEGCLQAMAHLTHVQWDNNDAAATREARNQMYEMLGVEPPPKLSVGAEVEAANEMVQGKQSRGIVAATYKSLVQEAGY